MESLKKTYDKWRWLTYNQLDELLISLMSTGEFPINIGQKKYSDNINFKKYTDENIQRYKKGDFLVSSELIEAYDRQIYSKAKEMVEKESSYFGKYWSPRSIFIENCLVNIASIDRDELKNIIKRNIIFYHWWDIMTFNDLNHCITDTHFLKSTCKLIIKENLHGYFNKRFKDKVDFINCLLSHFEPRDSMIVEMNSTFRGGVIFDYRWLFQNELIKSIRIFENECRLEHGEKIVGSFYNENLLFREIKKTYEAKYRVVSQGSPEWLGLQRFDIYFPDLNFAIEYQGEQHQQPVDFGGKGDKIAKQLFQDNLRRDKEKREKPLIMVARFYMFILVIILTRFIKS